MNSDSRHYCQQRQLCNCIPTKKELLLLGVEDWQIKLIRQLPRDAQWEAHDEFIRRLMSPGDEPGFYF